MKIKCQEHYDKVAEYAKSLGDTTLEETALWVDCSITADRMSLLP